MANFISDFFENRGWLNIVQRNKTTGGLEVAGVAITGATSYTFAQFLALDVANYDNYTILISDIPSARSSVNGVLVQANSAGTGWRWIQTPSLTQAIIVSSGLTLAQASGWRIFVSDLGTKGAYLYCDGTRFKAEHDFTLAILSSNVQLAGGAGTLPIIATVAKQTEIPRILSKSIWGDGDILEIHQLANKVGATDVMSTAVYIGGTSRAVDQNETGANTLIDSYSTGGGGGLNDGLHWRLQRVSATSVKPVGANGMPALGGAVGGAALANVTVPNLDTQAAYVDATIRVSATTTDTSLTLTGYSLRLLASGAA